jgi:Lantibiotic dehydratase, N terminus
MEDHLVALTGDWAVWRDFAVRSAGFAVGGLDVFAGPDESARLEEVARHPAFREAVTWQNREALASAVDKLAGNERGSPARRLRREEIVASYWQRYCAKNDTIGFFGPLAWGSFDETGPAAAVRAGELVRERVVHLEVWAVEAVARAAGIDSVLPMSPYPERDLRGRLAGRPDSTEPARALAALDRLEAARDVAALAGRDELLGALTALDRLFEELTGRPAARREGDSDGGRTVAYLDCMRDLELTFGSAVLAELRATLPALLESSRWWCAIAYAAGRERLERIAEARGPGPLAPMLGELMSAAFGLSDHLTREAAELQRRWAALLDASDDTTIAERAAAAFADHGDAWPLSVYSSADLQIAAASIEAIEQGDFRIVIGDFHGGNNPLLQGMFARRHPDPVALSDWVGADVRRQLVNLPPRGGAVQMTARMSPFVRGKDYIHIVSGPHDPAPEGVRTVSIGDLSVEEGHVSDRAGSLRLPLADLFWLPVFISSLRSFDPFGQRGLERVTIGRTVVRRARCSSPAGELPRDPDAIASWARDQGMPRCVFVRSPLERKPIYVDLASPTLLRVLTRFLRPAAEQTPNAPVVLTEMLPGPDECWLADNAGRYTSEFRVVAVNKNRRPA